ncbi:MAG: patatin-like phospholipase family protein [Bacteroidales bacterium]|nr:patatin-like phospholipase family protein [Bacteroidales bacterium]
MKQKVALVLSGGGARGIAHIGVIEELERRGYEITSVAGTSMGALIGGIYASGGLSVFSDWLSTLDKYTVFSLMDFTLSKDGIVKGKKVLEAIEKLVPDQDIRDCKIPFAAVATDLKTKKEIVFESGSLFDAIRASISIPALFLPYQLNNMLLIDGGVVNQMPLNRVKRTKGDMLIAVNVGAIFGDIDFNVPNLPVPVKKSKKERSLLAKIKQLYPNPFGNMKIRRNKNEMNYVKILMESSNIMINQIVELNKKLYPPDLLIEIPLNSYNTLEFYKAEEIKEMGVEAVCRTMEKYY